MATIVSAGILVFLFAFVFGALTLPLEPLTGKSGEDQVKEAVNKAELAAKKAAQESGNNAELRVAAIKAKLAAQHVIKQHLTKLKKLHPKLKSLRKWGHARRLNNDFKSYGFTPRLRHQRFRHPGHRNAFSNMISLNDLASDTTSPNNYHEDTTLEDRLALEAEEDKKYGAMSDNDVYGSSRSYFSNRDASQSIQNQVASESARELKEIQQQINAESQNSLGKTTIGQATAMFQGNPSAQPENQQKPRARNGMMDVQTDLNSALNNAEGMNTDSNLMTPQLTSTGETDAVGANGFTGLGEEKQPGELAMNMPGMSSLASPGQSQTEQMGEAQASMEGPQAGDSAQSAISALAAGAGQAAFPNPQPGMANEGAGQGGLGEVEQGGQNMSPGEPGGIQAMNGGALGTNNLGGGEMMPSGGMEGNGFGGGSMKKSKINDRKRLHKTQ